MTKGKAHGQVVYWGNLVKLVQEESVGGKAERAMG